MKIRIATRKSELALWQAKYVSQKLESLAAVSAVELVPLSTRGDEVLDRSLQKIGGKGLFIKELETAMQAGDADIAVHSMKDVPAEMPAGFCIGAVLERADPSDALVSDGRVLSELPEGATVGTSSLRRQAQLKAIRPDIEIAPLRGNVNTRLRKLDEGQFDAIILATAGLERLGMGDRVTQKFSPAEMLPAAAQGVVGIECLDSRDDLLAILAEMEDAVSALTTAAERAVSRSLDASCQSPVASFAELDGNELSVQALVASEDGSTVLRETVAGLSTDASSLGETAARRLLEAGADELLREQAG